MHQNFHTNIIFALLILAALHPDGARAQSATAYDRPAAKVEVIVKFQSIGDTEVRSRLVRINETTEDGEWIIASAFDTYVPLLDRWRNETIDTIPKKEIISGVFERLGIDLVPTDTLSRVLAGRVARNRIVTRLKNEGLLAADATGLLAVTKSGSAMEQEIAMEIAGSDNLDMALLVEEIDNQLGTNELFTKPPLKWARFARIKGRLGVSASDTATYTVHLDGIDTPLSLAMNPLPYGEFWTRYGRVNISGPGLIENGATVDILGVADGGAELVPLKATVYAKQE